MWANLSFSPSVQNTQPLTFFEKYSLEIQKQQQEKQKKKVQFKKTKKQKVSSTGNPSRLPSNEDLYPSKNPEKQLLKIPEKQSSSQQFTIASIQEDVSSDPVSICSTETNESQSLSEQESIETQSSWSIEEQQADLTEILMANPQPSTSQNSTNIFRSNGK
jgi:hypothetical protein